MRNETYNEPEITPGKERIQLIKEILKLMYGLYFNKKNLLPLRRHSADLYVPGVFFLISSFLFLLAYRFFPLFEEPTQAMSVTRMIQGSSEYFTSHSLENLISQFWFVIIGIIIGATILCLLLKALGGDFDEIMYMLGVTAAVFSVILLYFLFNFFGKLFLIKLAQRYHLPVWVREYPISGFSLQQLLLLLIFLIFPLLRVNAVVWKKFQLRGILSLTPMITLLIIGAWLLRHYSEPATLHKPLPPIARIKVDTLHREDSTASINPDSLIKRTALDTGIHTIQGLMVHIPTPAIDSQVVLSPAKHDTVMRFYTGVFRHHYFMKITVAVTNRSDKMLEFPYYKALQINFAVNRIGLRQQYGHFSKDFTFNIERVGVMKAESVCIAPRQTQVFHLRKSISAKTYKYFRDYIRHHADQRRTAVFILAMRDKLTKHSIDIKPVYPWAIRFGWNEAYGFDAEYAFL